MTRRTLRFPTAALLGLALSLTVTPLLARAQAPEVASSDEPSALEQTERRLESRIAAEGYAPGVLYDLGNAYLRDGEPGLAILQYERARLLAPGDAAIEHNLEQAREAAGVAAPETRAVEALVARWPTRRWMLLGAIALGLFVIGSLGLGVLRRGRRLALAMTVLTGVVTVACAAAIGVGTLGRDRAVVLEPDLPARVAPFEGAEPVFDVREGEVLRMRDRRGAFREVVDSRGRRGWLPDSSLAPIVPRAS
ncbi:MAG: hypothetical protein R3B82_22795 [Sandaracinaceae bacterium]